MTRAAIKHGEEQLRQAVLAGDVVILERLLDDALVFVDPSGAILGKEEDLENHRSGRQDFTRLVTRDLVVHLHEHDVAVTTLVADVEGTLDGAPFSGTFRYLRTWQRVHDGAWRIIAGSVMPLRDG